MKILALNPKDFYPGWPVQNDFGRELYRCPGLAFQVMKRLLPPGHEMRFLDAFFEPIPMKKYLELVRWAEVVAFNIHSSYGAISYATALKQIKRVNPRARIVAGGHHAFLFRRRWLELGMDAVATGEGELMFGPLIEQLAGKRQYDRVPGLAFVSDGQYVETAAPPQLANLDDSPEPDLSLINFTLYPNWLWKGGGWGGSLECSRGCIFKCRFCATPVFWKGTQRYKSFGRVAKEVESLLARKVRAIMVIDDGFGNDPNYTRELIKVFSRFRDRMKWFCFFRVDSLLKDPDMIDLAGQAGLRATLVGFESLDQDALRKNIGKSLRTTPEMKDIQDIYGRFRRNRIMVIGAFISGHPEIEQSRRTSYFEARKVCDDPKQTEFMPFPGTAEYDQLAERYPVKDMFFHDIKLSAFPGRKVESFRFNVLNILDLPRSLRALLRGFNYRRYLLLVHRYLWTKMLRVNRRKLRDYLLISRKDLTEGQKQEKLFQYYLEDPAYQQWLDRQEKRIWF